MFLNDPQPNEAMESDLRERSLSVDDPLPFEPVRRSETSRYPDQPLDPPAPLASGAAGEAVAVAPEPPPAVKTGSKRWSDTRWWALAAGSALLLALLTVGGIWLITKKPSTVDQLVILTVPSGAEIKLNSTHYGYTPVKLEQLPIGSYTLTITKEGYEPIVESISIYDSTPLEYRLKLITPSDSEGLTIEERIKRYQQWADEAFARGDYAIPFDESALYYTLNILDLDPINQTALEMRETLRKRLLQVSQTEASRGDMGKAQEIMSVLIEYYPKDEEVRAAASRLEGLILSRRGDVQSLVRKAEEALRAGNLTEPYRTSAYYYAKQALAIDRTNAQALAVHQSIKERLLRESEQSYADGEVDQAIRQLDNLTTLFSQDSQIRDRLREMTTERRAEATKAQDPRARRINGLEKYRKDDFDGAIPDLRFALVNGQGTVDVIFALARSYMKLGQFDEAAHYFNQVPSSGEDAYRSAVAALGDIAAQKGDTATAVSRYKQARQLGGSAIYTIPMLEDKIAQIEKRQVEKASEPSPVSIQVKHLHGGIFKGSCSGTLAVSHTGVSYDGEHAFSANLTGVRVEITKDEMTINLPNGTRKFKVARSLAEHFREALTKYQNR